MDVLKLYKLLLRESAKFPSYNFRLDCFNLCTLNGRLLTVCLLTGYTLLGALKMHSAPTSLLLTLQQSTINLLMDIGTLA